MRLEPLAITASVIVLLLPTHLLAHEPGLSTLILRPTEDRFTARLTLAPADVASLVASINDPQGTEPLHRAIRDGLQFQVDGNPIQPTELRSHLEDDNLHLDLALDAAGASYSVHSNLFPHLPRGHRQYVVVEDLSGNAVEETLLHAASSTLRFRHPRKPLDMREPEIAARPQHRSSTFGSFFALGFEHILIGYDHLAFVLALIVTGIGLRQGALLITSFTVAHSLTLALATFDLVCLPAEVVEPLIALSVAYVALENLLRGKPRLRAGLTFCFGLIHGLGFASVLQELSSATTGSVTIPLVAFNLGVEVGQLTVAAFPFAILWQVRTRPLVVRSIAAGVSALLFATALYWLVERAA